MLIDSTRFKTALSKGEAGLVCLVNEFKAEGLSQLEIAHRFEQFRALLRAKNREADEDCVMDVMDLLCGWCSSQSNIEEISDKKV